MLLAEAGCVLMGFILCISGVQGRAKSICAIKGSSVDLPCPDQYRSSRETWYTEHWDGSKFVQNEFRADGNRVIYRISGYRPTLTIKDLRESDQNKYCCKDNTAHREICLVNTIQLQVADLQVKVIPTTEGQTVTLMCSTSCPLTEKPAAYIWYKNGEFLYQDWSPWYQELVSSDQAVRYSCAIKGYEDLRAPEVSVDSVTSTCFNVTYAKRKMCSYKQTSVEEPCTITYPREIHVKKTPTEGYVNLTCQTSCPLIDSQTAYRWYRDEYRYHMQSQQILLSSSYASTFSCAVKGLEELRSAEVCTEDGGCWIVNCVRRRICALEDSSVNISSEYSHPKNQTPKYKLWYKITRRGMDQAGELMEDAGPVEYHDDMKNHHILRINNLKINDSAEYIFTLQQQRGRWKLSHVPLITLVVTGLNVEFTPSAVVTEGQRVTLTCSTSCPLTDNTNYIWYLNSRPLTLPENQHKHLLLDPVSSQHAGNYSCVVKTAQNIKSHEKTFTVRSVTRKWALQDAARVGAALLFLMPLAVFWWVRRKMTSRQSPRTETSNNMQLNPVHENISTQSEQDDHHYNRLNFSENLTDDLYSTIQPVPSN